MNSPEDPMYHALKIIYFVVLLSFTFKAEIIDYCKYGTKNGPHSACNNDCKPKKDNYPIDPYFEWREEIVDCHNYYRNFLAGGGNKSGGNSEASNMIALSYDMGLEFTVACWVYSHGLMEHDKSRGTPKFPVAGQNLWDGNNASAIPTTREGIMHILWRFYEELTLVRAPWIDKYPPKKERYATWAKEGLDTTKELQVGHFTQLVWAESTHVGCAMSYRRNMGKFLLGCNYGPAGNVEGHSVYKRGSPATQCPPGKKPNRKYPNLCGEVAPWPPEAHYEGVPEMNERWRASRMIKGRFLRSVSTREREMSDRYLILCGYILYYCVK